VGQCYIIRTLPNLFSSAKRPNGFRNSTNYISNGYGSHSVVKGRGREADDSPQSGAEVRNVWSYTSTPPHDTEADVFLKLKKFVMVFILINVVTVVPAFVVKSTVNMLTTSYI
jgi:hypothetical protein